MADDASERNETRPARGSGQGQGDGAPGGPDPRTPLPPGPRDRPGWRISPAPDGRGATPPKPPMMPFSWGRFLLILAALLAVNYLLVALLAPPKPRLSIPYSPTFLAEVRADNVKSISSQGETVKGDFKRKVRYPPSDKNATAATRFSTQVPTFANNNQLSSLLQQHHVVVNAKPENERSLWETLLVGFGPTLLLVAAFLFLFRRAARAGGAGGLMSFGRSRARRVEASEQTVTFADVAGIDEAKAELTEIVDFLRDPGRYRRLGARIPRVRWRAKPACRSSRSPPPSSSRRSSESAPRACGTCSPRPRRPPRRSSSSTSSTRSGARGPAQLASAAGTTSASRRSTRS
jgi:cell division protease FtsH